jgi:hypothetical protein
LLVPNLLAIDMYIEHPARTLNQLGIHVELFLDCCRQTGGLGKIVSLRAILDGDGHDSLLNFIYNG